MLHKIHLASDVGHNMRLSYTACEIARVQKGFGMFWFSLQNRTSILMIAMVGSRIMLWGTMVSSLFLLVGLCGCHVMLRHSRMRNGMCGG